MLPTPPKLSSWLSTSKPLTQTLWDYLFATQLLVNSPCQRPNFLSSSSPFSVLRAPAEISICPPVGSFSQTNNCLWTSFQVSFEILFISED